MSVDTDKILRVSVRQTMQAGQDHVNVYHYACNFNAPESESDILDALATDIALYYSPFNTAIGTAQSGLDIKADVVELVSGRETVVQNVGTTLWDYSTSAGGDVLPPGACLLIKLLTSRGKVWGRKFLSGFSEAYQNNGVWAQSLLDMAATAGARMLEDIVVSAGGVLVPCVLSKLLGEATPILEAGVSADVAYQRRRRLGSGS